VRSAGEAARTIHDLKMLGGLLESYDSALHLDRDLRVELSRSKKLALEVPPLLGAQIKRRRRAEGNSCLFLTSRGLYSRFSVAVVHGCLVTDVLSIGPIQNLLSAEIDQFDGHMGRVSRVGLHCLVGIES
jgi:hypothetical protein